MFDWALYNLKTGARLGWFEDRSSSHVGLGLNLPRTAQVVMPLDDPICDLVSPLATVLRGWYWKRPFFAGAITLPKYSSDGDKLEINAVDPSFRLQASHVNQRADGGIFAYQAAIDQSEIMWRLITHAQPTGAQQSRGVPMIPVIRGVTPASFTRDRAYDTGKQIWAGVAELADVTNGVDFDLSPIEPGTAMANTHALVQFDTYSPSRGTNKSSTARFADGLAGENCVVNWDPAGDQVLNRYTLQGQSEEGQASPSYTSEQQASQDQYGIYAGFGGDPDISVINTLAEYTQGKVQALAFPVDYFDITPAVSGRGYTWQGAKPIPIKNREFAEAPHFGPGADFDYFLGDTIGVYVRRGAIDGYFEGRVTDAELTETPNGDVIPKLSVGPSILAANVTGGAGGVT